MEHLRAMGEGHAATNRSLAGGKESFLAMAAAYQRTSCLFLAHSL